MWNANIPLLRSPLPIVINILSCSKTGLRFTLHPHQQFKHGSLLLCSINTSCLLICGDSIKVITCHNQTWKLSVTGKARQSFDWRRWAKSLAWLSYQGKDGSKLLGEAEPYWTVCKMFTAQSRGSLNSESQLKLLFTTTFGLFCTEKLLDCSLQNRQNCFFVQFVKKKEAQSFWVVAFALLASLTKKRGGACGNTLKMICHFSCFSKFLQEFGPDFLIPPLMTLNTH